MKRVVSDLISLFLIVAFAMAPSAPAWADHPTGARPLDIQRLQDDLAALDDSLAALPASHPRYQEFRDRADALREDLVYLKVQIRRHRRNNQEGLGASQAEVNATRADIRALQNDIDSSLNRRYSGAGSINLPQGTELEVRLEQPLSSKTARVEDRFDATVARSVYVDGRIVVPAGSRVQGTVTQAEPAQRPARGGRLSLSFDRLLLDDGTSVTLSSRLVQVKEDIGSGQTVKSGAIGAVLGAVLGSVLGGKKGGLVGVLLGGAGGAITSSGDDVELPEGTVFTLQLERPATVLRR